MIDPSMLSEAIFDHEAARNCLLGMGMTSENVAEKYNISRKE
jgi:acetyl-CoA acyltransferase 1